MLFIQYDDKGFGWFEVNIQKRVCGGWKDSYKTIRRKLKFTSEGKPRIFYDGELRCFDLAVGDSELKDYNKMLAYFKR